MVICCCCDKMNDLLAARLATIYTHNNNRVYMCTTRIEPQKGLPHILSLNSLVRAATLHSDVSEAFQFSSIFTCIYSVPRIYAFLIRI